MNYSPFEISQSKNYNNFNITVDGKKNWNLDLSNNSNYSQTKYKGNKNNTKLALQGITYGLSPSANGPSNDMTVLFFSPANVERLQKMIKKEVFTRTKGKFKLNANQREEDLIVSMRAVYLGNAKFLPEQPVRQVKLMNRLVIDFVVPGMITKILQTYDYINEINKPIEPIMRPLNVNNGGRKILPALTTVWNF